MKRKYLSLLSFVLVILLTASFFVSCGGGNTTDSNTSGKESETVTENKTEESLETNSTEKESDSEKDSETDEESSEVIAPPSLECDNSLLIENAYNLANGVNAYFVDGTRKDFALENQNMKLEYALANYKDQLVTSLKNSKGKTYIENTCDVFVKMKDGGRFYASNSTKSATANLYRFGYYMYEARFEEQLFTGEISVENSYALNHTSVTKNQVKTSFPEEGTLHINITGTDPYITFKNVNVPAKDYNYFSITLKANVTNPTNLVIYLIAGSNKGYSESQAKYFTFYNDGEYHTYNIPISEIDDYTGNITGIRFDFSGAKGSSFDITEAKLVKGDDNKAPENLELNRSFFVYSDKLHHYLQIATREDATTGIESLGLETKISADTVASLIVKDKKGTHTKLEDVDWNSAECVGFDIKEAGIFGYILPGDNSGGKLEVTLEDGNYIIIQSTTPENGTIEPSGKYDADKKRIMPIVPLNGNDIFVGQRIYTDENHDFAAFLHEAEVERNPLTSDNIIVDAANSTDAEFVGYDVLRGIYTVNLASDGFNGPYYRYPNKHYNVKFTVKGDSLDRNVYVMAAATGGCLECAALLDEKNMMLPIPIEVGKNFSESTGERNLWNIEDKTYSEAIIPMVIKAGSQDSYNFIHLYQNWGNYPLKQVSWIQFYAPYYHLSTGVTETNCIVPYYSCKNARGLNTLPDHRTMSAPFWSDQPQHNSAGSHKWLVYTDANGVYSASENTLNTIDSFGPTYADVTSHYLSDDGNIKVSYTHMEFPQTDENRAYYEMKYEVLGDVSFNDFSRDFHFYSVSGNDPTGVYQNVGYLNENNESIVANAAQGDESFKYVLGDKSPYFSFFNMKNYTSTSQQGYANLSFLVYNSEFVINGQKATPNFAIVNENGSVRITLNLENVTLKKGDSFTINAIVLPWGSQESVYDSKEFAPDHNVRMVRENTLLNPLTPVAGENCEVIESVFLPKLKTTNGKSAEFTLKGGENNVAVRIYGFDKLTVPYIEEYVDGEWVEYKVSSAYSPDIQGNAHYYDGYCVYYDKNATFSYSFIVTMDNSDKDGRTFRITAEEDFKSWPEKLPEIEGSKPEDLPLNVYVDAPAIYNAAASVGTQFGGVILSDDKSYVSLKSKGLFESYFTVYPGGTVATGQYMMLKYRLPDSNTDDITVFEVFSSTKNSGPKSEDCFYTGSALINDGQWHVLVIDMASWEKASFAKSDDGTYKAQFTRLDPFYQTPEGNCFDIALFGMSDNMDDIYALVTDIDTIQYVEMVGGKSTVKNIDTETKAEIIPPSDDSTGDAFTSEDNYNIFLNPSDLLDKISEGGNGHGGEKEVAENGEYIRVHYCTDTNKTENYRKESYFYIYKSDSNYVTGQYLVLKYRAPEQVGSIQIYSSTQNPSASDPGGSITLNAPGENNNGLFVGDGEWQTVIIDLSEHIATYTANSTGEYCAKHIRVDLFNFNSPLETGKTTYVDIAFIGITDDISPFEGE